MLISRVLNKFNIPFYFNKFFISKNKKIVLKRIKNPTNSEEDLTFKDFYTNGYSYIDIFKNAQGTLDEITNLFKNKINEFEYLKNVDLNEYVIDGKGYLWLSNKFEGILDFRVFNPNHTYFSKFKKKYNLKDITYEKLLNKFPEIEKKINSKKNIKILNCIFKKNFREPYMIKIERKIHSNDSDKYNENFIHLDEYNTNYKFYIYLNDVDYDSGPLQVIPQTHHWSKFLELSKITYYKNNKTFNMNSKEIKNILKNPFIKLTGKAGQCISFTGSMIHSATNLKKDKTRWTIQVYYASEDEWVTDLTN